MTDQETLPTILVVENGHPIAIQHLDENPLVESIRGSLESRNVQSMMGVPLQVRGKVIGVILVSSNQADNEFNIKLAETVAGQIAGAIENVRLFKEEQQQRQIAESLRYVATILNSSLDQKTILKEVLKQLGQVIQYDSVGVFLQENNFLVLSSGLGLDMTHAGKQIAINGENPTVGHCFKTKQSFVIADVSDSKWKLWSNHRPIRGWMGAPFLIGNEAIGVIAVESFKVGVYGEKEAQILQIFANQAAIAIQNARFFAQIQKTNQRFTDELAFAQQIQQSLLPPPYFAWPELEVICYNIAAREVGGDFYQYEKLASTLHPLISRYVLAVGDVSGKGVSAALLMVACLSQLNDSLSLDLSPTERLGYLDKVISPYTKPRHQNCAMCYVEIEIRNQELRITNEELRITNEESPVIRNSQFVISDSLLHTINAGCIPPYIKRTDGSVEWSEIGGFALGQGLGAEVGYQEISLPLSKGDIIILVSDGVIEANNSDGKMIGFEEFKQIVLDGPTSSAAEMMAHLQFEVVSFMGDAEPHDDLTIIVAQLL